MWNLRSALLFIVVLLVGGLPGLAQKPIDAQAKASAPVTVPGDKLNEDDGDTSERYRIGFQDVLDVQVFRHPDLSMRVPVSPNGTIMLFRLDRPVVAICKTPLELATEIENAYREKYLRDPRVRVLVAEQKSQAVMIIGAVVTPGTYYVARRVHLLEMLALAGGPNKESGTRLIVARTGSTSVCKEKDDPADNEQLAVVGFKIRDVQEGKESFWMRPGDVISVSEADVVYVYGNVNKQGSYKVREPITLTQAIVTAEGLKPAANKSKVRILRQKSGSVEREELVFDLNQIDKGKVKDPFLEPNDIVAVSQDKAKSILLGFVNSIKSSIPSAVYRIP